LRQLIFAGNWQRFVQQVAAHWSVTVNVTNSGQVAGSEIVQVYAGKLPTPLPTAPKSLAGFAKAALPPGKSQDVTIALPPGWLSYWDVNACVGGAGGRCPDSGRRVVSRTVQTAATTSAAPAPAATAAPATSASPATTDRAALEVPRNCYLLSFIPFAESLASLLVNASNRCSQS
jgi:hypothetical protein